MRERINLNFDWFFNSIYKEEQLNNYKEMVGFSKVDIPHCNVEVPFNYFDERSMQIVSCYKKILDIKKEYENKSLNMIFEGVAHKATIYINDDFVTIHKGGYDRFVVDITEYVKYGEENFLTLICDANENPNIPPFSGFIDYLGYGGIYREVYLEIADKDKILDFFVKTKNAVDSITATVDLTINKTPVIIEIEVFDKDKQVSLNRYHVNRERETVDFDVKDRVLWNLDNPKVYDIVLRMFDENTLLDEVKGSFGYREVEFKKDGFYLNREYIKLRGLNRHQSYPYVGYAMPKSAQEKDADILKYYLGVNIVRTSHYMQSTHFLNRCDEIGLLVLEEIPGWQTIGGEDFRYNTIENVKKMIVRDKNHPSIISWGVRINESMDDKVLYNETNKVAHSLDNTRGTCGIRNFINSDFLEDIYTFNDFTHDGGKNIIQKPRRLPHLITEHNGHMYPTKSYDNEPRRVEQALRHLRVINASNARDDVSGAIGWCMNDYNTHKDFGSGDKVCYHGVLDMFRIPKFAGFAYASQRDKKVFMEVLSSVDKGDYDASSLDKVYVATNCEYVKLFKNDIFVATFYPDKKEFNDLVHPPIVIEDMIGTQLEKQEGFKKSAAKTLKKVFMLANKKGWNLGLINYVKCFFIMISYKLKKKDLFNLYMKYCIGVPNVSTIYRFDGYINENVAITRTISPVTSTVLTVDVDKKELVVGDTYDVTRVVVKKTDQNGRVLPYANDPALISVKGGITLIGPNKVSLQGGAIGFWVRTNQTDSKGTIEVTINNKTIKEEILIK